LGVAEAEPRRAPEGIFGQAVVSGKVKWSMNMIHKFLKKEDHEVNQIRGNIEGRGGVVF